MSSRELSQALLVIQPTGQAEVGSSSSSKELPWLAAVQAPMQDEEAAISAADFPCAPMEVLLVSAAMQQNHQQQRSALAAMQDNKQQRERESEDSGVAASSTGTPGRGRLENGCTLVAKGAHSCVIHVFI